MLLGQAQTPVKLSALNGNHFQATDCDFMPVIEILRAEI